jgi:tryptophanyl-tRNA synthetase
MKRLLANPGEIDAVLADGAARARVIAEPILRQAEDIVGFIHV